MSLTKEQIAKWKSRIISMVELSYPKWSIEEAEEFCSLVEKENTCPICDSENGKCCMYLDGNQYNS